MRAPYPAGYAPDRLAAWGLTEDVLTYVETKRDLITGIRALRAEAGLAPALNVRILLHPATDALRDRLARDADSVKAAVRADALVLVDAAPEAPMPSKLLKAGVAYLPLDGLVDTKAEAEKLDKEIAKLQGFLNGVNAKLNNEAFVSKAPAPIIQNQRDRKAELEAQIATLTARRAAL